MTLTPAVPRTVVWNWVSGSKPGVTTGFDPSRFPALSRESRTQRGAFGRLVAFVPDGAATTVGVGGVRRQGMAYQGPFLLVYGAVSPHESI